MRTTHAFALVLLILAGAVRRCPAHCTWSRAELVMLTAEGTVGVIAAYHGDTEGGTPGYSLHTVRIDSSGHRDTEIASGPKSEPDWILPYHPSYGAGGAPHTRNELNREKKLRKAFLDQAVKQFAVDTLSRGTMPIALRDSAGPSELWVTFSCGDTAATTLGLADRSVTLTPSSAEHIVVPATAWRTATPGVFVVQVDEYQRWKGDTCPPAATDLCSRRATRFRLISFGP